MELLTAKQLAARMIAKGEEHADYAYVVDLADKYKKLITGKNISSLLTQFIQREDAEMFAQRVRMTQAITPAIASAIRMPYSKVTRNDKVVKNIGIKEESKKALVEKMMSGFYGNSRKKNKGLDGFMRSRFVDLTFTDPNAWLVVEWQAAVGNEPVQPKPFVVSSSEAMNFSVENDEVEWLFVRQTIKYLKASGLAANGEAAVTEIEGKKYTLYDEDFTVVYEQVDRSYAEQNIVLADTDEIVEISKNHYIVRYFEPKLGFAPAFRIGYERDLNTEGRTYVNPFEPAMPYFMKSIKAVSELDLTIALHVFPQKLQYVQRCMGISKEKKCVNGRIADGSECASCKGTGYKVHTTAQDVVLLPMPTTKDEMLDLNGLIAYSAPPANIIDIQTQYVKDLKDDAIHAVFNSQTFTQPKIVKTATQQNVEMESVYDKLAPFADKFSELWREVVSVFVILAALDIDSVDIVHSFPSDLKLKTVTMLLQELAAVNDSQAPTFLQDEISQDIAAAMYADDPLALKKYEVKRRFFPFNGKSADDVQLATTSEFVPKFDKVLYFNFEKIFAEIDRDKKEFWLMPYPAQWKIVGEKVNGIIDELDKAGASRFTVGDLTGANSTNQNQQASQTAANGANPTNQTGAKPAKPNSTAIPA